MPRGGFREGAGRKKEYTEPVRKSCWACLSRCCRSWINMLITHLSRPKAIAALLKQIHRPEEPARQKTQHKVVRRSSSHFERNLRRVPTELNWFLCIISRIFCNCWSRWRDASKRLLEIRRSMMPKVTIDTNIINISTNPILPTSRL